MGRATGFFAGGGGILIAVASAVAFGLYPPAARAVYADGGNAVFVILLTTFMRALALALFCAATRRRLFKTLSDTRQAASGGFFQALSILGIFASLQYLPGPVMIIIVFSHTLMLLFFLAWKGEVRLDASTVAVTVSALAGLALVLDLWSVKETGSLIGMALAFMAALATVSRMYIYGRQTRERNPAVVGAETFIFATLFALFVLVAGWPALPQSAAGYLWAGLAAGSLTAGTFGMFYGIALLGSFRFSMFLKLEPVFTSLFSALLIHDMLKGSQYAGIGLVTASLAIFQFLEHRRKTLDKTENRATVRP